MAVTHTASAWIRVMSDRPIGTRLAPRPAGVGAGPGGGRPGGHGHDQEHQIGPGQSEHPAGDHRGAPPGAVAGVQAQLDRHGQGRDADHEVGHDHVQR